MATYDSKFRPINEHETQGNMVESISGEVAFAGGQSFSKVVLDSRGDPKEGNSKNKTRKTTPKPEGNGRVCVRKMESTPVPFLGPKVGPKNAPLQIKT